MANLWKFRIELKDKNQGSLSQSESISVSHHIRQNRCKQTITISQDHVPQVIYHTSNARDVLAETVNADNDNAVKLSKATINEFPLSLSKNPILFSSLRFAVFEASKQCCI